MKDTLFSILRVLQKSQNQSTTLGTHNTQFSKMRLRSAALTAEMVIQGLNLEKKVVLVTGVNSGLGKETARVLTMRNALVIGTGKTLQLAKEACLAFGERAIPMECELSDPESIRRCIDQVKIRNFQLDAIVANA